MGGRRPSSALAGDQALPPHSAPCLIRAGGPREPAERARWQPERLRPVARRAPICGSSPRMRGTGGAPVAELALFRFVPAHAGNRVEPPGDRAHHRSIPAHAGNRCAGTGNRAARTVHPRACGEQLPASQPARARCGSSPRMRGTARNFTLRNHPPRFIPAHAGNSQRRCSRSVLWSVHPRACGEQHARQLAELYNIGSSPRMRGTAWCRPPAP